MIFAVFDPSPLTVCINCSFLHLLFVIAGLVRRANMHHHAKCCADRSNRCRDIAILIFRISTVAILDIFKFKICNGPNGHDGRTAPHCQISFKSLKPRRRCVNFRFFKIAAAAILDFGNYEFVTVGAVRRVELHHRAKCRQNRPNCG